MKIIEEMDCLWIIIIYIVAYIKDIAYMFVSSFIPLANTSWEPTMC